MTSYSEISIAFSDLAERIEKIWPQHTPLGKTLLESQGWPHLPLTPKNISDLSVDIGDRFREMSNGDPEGEKLEYWQRIADQAKSMNFANFGSDPATVAKSTCDFLFWVALNLPASPASVDWDSVQDHNLVPRKLARRLKGIEARMNDLEPRSEEIKSKIEVIEAAHDAAERLPTDMEELTEASSEIKLKRQVATSDAASIDQALSEARKLQASLISLHDEAQKLVEQCHEAYRFTTSTGLAGAFHDRSKILARTGWIWAVILVIALLFGVILGGNRLDKLQALFEANNSSTSLVILSLVSAVMGVGGAIWLAWLATRNIGQSFRLSEDYAFKSSVSKAYEGYRKEAVNLDEAFAKRLFSSALTRLDEAPSRFIEQAEHSSPFEALLNNPTLKVVLERSPELKSLFLEAINDGKTAIVGVVGAGTAAKALTKGKKPKSDELASLDED